MWGAYDSLRRGAAAHMQSFVTFIYVQNKLQTTYRLNKSVEQDNKAYNMHLQLPKFTMNTNKDT